MVDVRDVPPEVAARVMAGLSSADPRGLMKESDIGPMCQAGRCVQVASDRGVATLVLVDVDGTVWVDAARADGPSARLCDDLDDAIAATPGARRIAFQTKRRGLVRRAIARGYRVVGYILEKEL